MKELGPPDGARIPGAPLDPPMLFLANPPLPGAWFKHPQSRKTAPSHKAQKGTIS